MNIKVKAIIVITCCVYFFIGVVDISSSQNFNKAIFLDVGQGDSLFILTQDEKSVLIDTGKDITAATKIGKYLFDNSLDLLIITHSDIDHIGGVIDIKKSFQIKSVIAESNDFTEDLNLQTIENGTKVLVGCCLQISFFNVESNLLDNNERSLAMLITSGDTDFFVAGDLPKSLEDSLVANLGDIEVLKVGHHGSNTSTSDYFINRIKPEYAVISVGKENRYGHPHREVLDVLEKNGIDTYRTDELGDIIIEFDAKSVAKISSD